MKKETLLLSNITQDLKIVIKEKIGNTTDWRFSYIIPITLISVALGIVLKNVWLPLLIFSVAAYHIVRYIVEFKTQSIKKKAVMEVIGREDISISVVRLSHISSETIYEPHRVFRRANATKTVTYYYFESGNHWRIPKVDKHYIWSKDYYISSQGLENISIQGDEFYFVSLQGYNDIAYIYPCKIFELGEKLSNDKMI